MDVELTPAHADSLQHVDEMGHGPAQPIGGPHSDDIELSPHRALEQCVEAWPLVAALGTADTLVLIDLDDLMTGASGPASQLVDLVCRSLLVGRDACIDGNAGYELLLLVRAFKTRRI